MRIQVGTLTSKLLSWEDTADRAWLIDYLSFDDPKARYTANKNAKISLYKDKVDRFPSGLLPMVMKAAPEEGIKIELIDARVPPCGVDPNADLEWLRDYQLETVRVACRRGRGILWLPTGAGKTEIIVGLTRALPCAPWLALVHRSQLADDIASRFEKRSPGLTAGRILEGDFDVPEDANLIAATFQTLVNWLKRDPEDHLHMLAKNVLATAKGLIVDECHTLPADTFYSIAMRTANAYYRFGLSGTPLARGDRKSIFALAALGSVIHRVKTDILIDRGVLARPTVRLVTVTQGSKRPTWPGVYGECIVRGASRNQTIIAIAKRAAKPGFVFVQQTAHGKAVAKMLTNAGMRAEFVWGNHSLSYRKSIIRRLVQGHFDYLVCSAVFQEGIDVPELRSVIVASGGKSVIATLQRLGRGMRVDRKKDGSVAEGGDRFECWDIYDRGNKWLERHSRQRLNAFTAEGFETFIEAEGTTALRPSTLQP